jgi:hypothetical protein
MLDWLGLGKVVSSVASEFIETGKEKAEANSINAESKVKGIRAIDPNGQMRRELARFASIAFAFYLVNCVILGYMVAFEIGHAVGARESLAFLKDLFIPVLTSWTAIVSASFGVNVSNNWKEAKLKQKGE